MAERGQSGRVSPPFRPLSAFRADGLDEARPVGEGRMLYSVCRCDDAHPPHGPAILTQK